MNRQIRKEHYEALARFLWHGGPYIVMVGTIIIGLYQFGFIDKPAWSADVKSLDRKIDRVREKVSVVQKDVEDVKSELSSATTRQLVIESEVKNTNRSLDKITEQLNLLINRGLNNSSPNENGE